MRVFYEAAANRFWTDRTFDIDQIPTQNCVEMTEQEYSAFMASCAAAGGNPAPGQDGRPIMVMADARPVIWSEFRARRDLYLARLGEIAGRYSRKGDETVVPPAADAIAQGLLDMPQDPVLLATPAAELSRAIVVAANALLRAQLTNPLTAATIKAALDQVFKQP